MPTRIGRHGMAVVPDPAKRWRVEVMDASPGAAGNTSTPGLGP